MRRGHFAADSLDNRDRFKGRAEGARRGVGRVAFVCPQVGAEPVLAGREEIPELRSVTSCADEHFDLQLAAGIEIDAATGAYDGRRSGPAHDLTGFVDQDRQERLAAMKPADVVRAHVAHNEIGLAAIPDLKVATLRMQAKLKPLNFHNLRIRPSR